MISSDIYPSSHNFHTNNIRTDRTASRAMQHNYSNPSSRGGLAPGALRRVRDHIEQQLAEKIQLCQLAAITGLSERHFARAFKQSLGEPPHRYILLCRIEVAKDLLKETPERLADISLTVGFSDQSHFSRLFANFTGETPGAFRRRHR